MFEFITGNSLFNCLGGNLKEMIWIIYNCITFGSIKKNNCLNTIYYNCLIIFNTFKFDLIIMSVIIEILLLEFSCNM